MQKLRAPPHFDLGDEDPLFTRNVSNGPPDRRRVSLRWLSGSVLAGVFSFVLVGGALRAAVGFDDYAIVRPAMAHTDAMGGPDTLAPKGDRYHPVAESKVSREVIQISTVTRSEDRDIVRVRPFAHVHTTLAAPVGDDIAAQIPAFNATEIYAENSDQPEPPADTGGSDSIYGAEVDGEVAIKTEDFPVGGANFDAADELPLNEVEQSVRKAAPFLAGPSDQVASLPFVDPARFDVASDGPAALTSLAVAITPENMSLIEKSDEAASPEDIAEKSLAVSEGASLRKMLVGEGATADTAAAIQSALVANFSFDFRAGQTIRIGTAPDGTGGVKPVRVSLFDGARHLATVALSDTGTYVPADAPAVPAASEVAEQTTTLPSVLPTVHAGLWGTALSLGMSPPLIKSLVHIFSYDADYQSRLAANDNLEVIYSAGEDGAEATGPEILYAALTLGGVAHRLYRYRDPADGSVDYYDPDGRTAQKFLVRKPVPQARFSSSFGMRRHPILRRYRLHSGVDWAAPVGTPILAAGNGTVEKIGTRSGYGRSITLKHANGYETTYNHMSGYARGLNAGDRVRLGQIIGYIGSSGLSTGPHLHFEVLVNGRFVDPMKIRLPRGHELQGASLASFEQERQRIDDLIHNNGQRVATTAAD